MPQIVNSIYYSANRGGIPRVESESVSVSSTEVTFTFNSDVSFSKNYSGLVLVKINQSLPTDTTTTLPIAFTSKVEGTKVLNTHNDENLTVADWKGTGIYLVYYGNGSIQML